MYHHQDKPCAYHRRCQTTVDDMPCGCPDTYEVCPVYRGYRRREADIKRGISHDALNLLQNADDITQKLQ